MLLLLLVVDELLTLIFVSPILQSYLRDCPINADGRCGAFATDAEVQALEYAWPARPRDSWRRIIACDDVIGEHAWLDWDPGEALPTTMMDRRVEAAHYIVELTWDEMVGFKARASRRTGPMAHINVVETQGLLPLVRRLRNAGLPPRRALVFIDSRSRVVLGPSEKGVLRCGF